MVGDKWVPVERGTAAARVQQSGKCSYCGRWLSEPGPCPGCGADERSTEADEADEPDGFKIPDPTDEVWQ